MSVVARLLKIPYTLGLVMTGLMISALNIDLGIHLTPELLMTLFLPGLLFDGAMNINTDELYKNIKTVTLLAFFGIILSVFGGGFILHYLLNVPWEISFLFAAIIAPTDPVAVIAIFNRLGVSKKLGIILEGEALFNDGTGIVAYRIFLGLLLTGVFSVTAGLFEFVRLVFGGIVLGFILGYLSSRLLFRKIIEDPFIELTLTTVLAYGSYLIAEHLGFSGVISTVTCGLVIGGYGLKFLSPQTKMHVASLWSYLGFVLNSFVFLLIGFEIHIIDLIQDILPVFIGFISSLFGRVIAVYFIAHVISNVDDSKIISGVNETIPKKWRGAIVWGGLRGGLSMVLVLSLPIGENALLDAWRPFLLTLVFGTVLLSLLFQGSTMGYLLKSLGLAGQNKRSEDYEFEVAKVLIYNASYKELTKLHEARIISKKIYERYKKKYLSIQSKSEAEIIRMLSKYPEIEDEQVKEVESSILVAQKSALLEGRKKGLYSEETLNKILETIDSDNYD